MGNVPYFSEIGECPLFRLDAPGALAVVFLERTLAQPDRRRSDLHQLVVLDELHRLLEGVANRRREHDVLVAARGADVGELLALERIHHEVVVAAVDADDLSLVDLVAVGDHELPALLQVEERVAEHLPCPFEIITPFWRAAIGLSSTGA